MSGKELKAATVRARRQVRLRTEDELVDMFTVWMRKLPDDKLYRLYAHFEIITNLEDDGSLFVPEDR